MCRILAFDMSSMGETWSRNAREKHKVPDAFDAAHCKYLLRLGCYSIFRTQLECDIVKNRGEKVKIEGGCQRPREL